MVKLAIICPIHNEEKNIDYFIERTFKSIQDLSELEVELYFSDNGSTDRSRELITKQIQMHKNIFYIKLSKNFGYQNSIKAALSLIESDLYVILDVDCQDPPELIPIFFKKFKLGNQVVFGRRSYPNEKYIMRFLRRFYYIILKFASDSEIELGMAEFALFSKKVRDAVLINRSTLPFLRAELVQVGFPRYGIDYSREKRNFGVTHYNFISSLKFGIAGILNSSTFLLRIMPFAAILTLLSSIILFFLFNKNLLHYIIIQLNLITLFISFIGIYLARVFHNSNGRPLFVVDFDKSILMLGKE